MARQDAGNVTVNMAAAPDYAGGYFEDFAMAGVSGIGAVFTFQKEYLVLDRTDGDNTLINLPTGQASP